MKEDIQEICLYICESEKMGDEEILGFTKIAIDEIFQRKFEEKSEYLMREDGLRTRSKLNFMYQLEPSKVFY